MSFLDIGMAAILVGFVFFIRKKSKDEFDFGRETTATFRGLAMLGIILHHIHNRLSLGSPILSSVGYLSTGLFFFISGYGNSLSLNKQINVKFSWLFKKLTKIYIPFFIAYVLYYLILVIMYVNLVPTQSEVIADLLTVSLPNEVSWFPKVILLCFLLHWVIRKLISDPTKQNTILLFSIILFMLVMWKTNHSSYWFNSVICYPIGCFVAKPTIFAKLYNFFRERKIFSFILFTLAFGISFLLSKYVYYVQFLCPVLLSFACYSFSLVFTAKTKYLSWVGNNSFEFYLFHIVCLQAFCILISTSGLLYTFAVLIGSWVMVYIYLQIRRRVTKKQQTIN